MSCWRSLGGCRTSGPVRNVAVQVLLFQAWSEDGCEMLLNWLFTDFPWKNVSTAGNFAPALLPRLSWQEQRWWFNFSALQLQHNEAYVFNAFCCFSTEHPLCPPHRAVEQTLSCQEGLCFPELCSLSCLALSWHVECTIVSATCWQRKSSEALIGASKQVQLRRSFQLSVLSHKQIKTLNEEQYIRKVVIQWKNYLLKSVTSLELRLE